MLANFTYIKFLRKTIIPKTNDNNNTITYGKAYGPPKKYTRTLISPMESTLYAARHTPPCTLSVRNNSSVLLMPNLIRLDGFFELSGFITSLIRRAVITALVVS